MFVIYKEDTVVCKIDARDYSRSGAVIFRFTENKRQCDNIEGENEIPPEGGINPLPCSDRVRSDEEHIKKKIARYLSEHKGEF